MPRFFIAILGLFLASCGHPASQRECEEIAERVAELELKHSVAAVDSAMVKEEVVKTRTWVRETSLKECVGKRITERAMIWFEKPRPRKIVNGCFK